MRGYYDGEKASRARATLGPEAQYRVHAAITEPSLREALRAGAFPVDATAVREQVPGAMSKTLFEKIIAREVPAAIVYEDELVLAFKDIKPQAPVHVLMVPKKPIARIEEAKAEDHAVLGHLLLKAAEVARQLGLGSSGFRLVFNNGPDAGEAVPHLHCHIIGGRKLGWPPG